ncbi:LPXTG cell wall anchor domain-containing protein [Nocardioides aurantiacus]|uniref:LPXTG-motif cell wall-anchored protein n=1 Tax=Nocardioides aurantiacus TaxID=86796 RepID=A0A3N2CYB8_9ACTN|nr:LPXTG cell wall anchor domain-containing protein [Nocardioides aurantiacus]ROR92527.1 LPXTG-motif cell wall-anchored protein [Nocardioides aurantiacus]
MKVTRLIALLVAAFFVLLAPTAAQAVSYPGEEGGVSATPPAPSGNGCYTSQVTVEGVAGETLTLVVIDADGNEVFNEDQAAGPDGTATFTVELCEPGSYLASGSGSESGELGSTEITVPQGSQGGGGDSGDGSTPTTGSSTGSGSGNLPATGADSGTMLTLAGALALLLVGGVTLVAAKRKAL